MGLDQYAYLTTIKDPTEATEFPKDAFGFFYWRKHYGLQEWMEKLWNRKRGAKRSPTVDFCGMSVDLTAQDIDALEATIAADKLPRTMGFLLGRSRPDDKDNNLEFIEKAREALAAGYSIFYTANW